MKGILILTIFILLSAAIKVELCFKRYTDYYTDEKFPSKIKGYTRISILGDSLSTGNGASYPPETGWPARFY